MKTLNVRLFSIALCFVPTSALWASIPVTQGEITGNIGVYSSYNLRGMTNDPENSKTTVQGGLTYSHASGVSIGYWGSTLDYSLSSNANHQDDSFESNLTASYDYKLNKDSSLTLGATYYYYYPADDANVLESLLAFNYKNASLSAQTLTKDVVWGNAGDTYLLASYSHDLPKDFSLNTALGAYYYNKEGKFISETKEKFAFRHATLGLAKAWDNGLAWNLDYIVGGDDRMGVKQKNKVVMGLNYSF
ncbi:MAG: TorF family putative porin [Acinetobacter sp.]|nr:TorF family putative porin [Acinetobacter sp.]